MKLGFMGLGQMGKHMAMNLHRCGEELIVCDVRTTVFPEFEEQGIRTTTNLQDIAACDIIFLCLPNTEIVQSVILSDNGLRKRLRAGQIIADMSTIDYAASVEITKALAGIGVEFMDAPVTGMEARAKDGTLTVICGGTKELYEKLMPYFTYMGNNILLMGSHGCGQLTKAINNTLFDINIAALAEILPMAVKLGLDPETIGSVINSGSGRSYASEFFIPRILKRNFGDGYPLEHAYKDLICTGDISVKMGVPLPVTHAATTTYQMALLKGLGHQDKGAMICIFEELLGVEYKK